MNSINFDNPWLLLVGILLLVCIIISFVFTINKENRTNNNVISFVCHIIMAIMVTLALARTTFEKVITETNVYVLADVSYSSNKNLDLIDEYIEDLSENLPRNSKLGIVCFGKDYQLLVNIGEDIKSVKEANVDSSATNITEALEYTSTLFVDNVIKRIVIISDGEETKNSNIVSVVQSLTADDIYIDAIYLDNNLKEDDKEVQINQVEYVDSTYLNQDESVYAVIQSNVDTRAIASLYHNNEVYEKAITLDKGYNTISFPLDTSTGGMHNYKLEISSTDDECEFNNSYIFNQNVSDKIKVLFISDVKEDEETAKLLYNDNKNLEIDYFINKYNVPFTIEDLCVYDEVVLSNIDIRKLENYSQFINSLEVIISEFGKSLITLGNTYIQNNYEDETLLALSNLLPVKYGNGDQDNKLVTLLIDISRSMENAYKLSIAKQATCAILDNIDDKLNVMAVAFYGDAGIVFEPTLAENREELKNKINSLDPYQGTFLGSALNFTYNFIRDLPYGKNEVILISDGLPYKEQEAASITTATKMAEANIVLSSIHIITKEGEALLRKLASICKGYYYFIESEQNVEGFVLNEVLNSLTEVVLERSESPVEILNDKDLLVEGIDSLPNVKGLYNNVKKSSAKVVLNATYTDVTDYSYQIPLYAYWNYGNGKVSSFSSSISGNWISHWLNSENSVDVLKRIVDVNQPEIKSDSAFIIETEDKGTNTKLIVNAPSLNSNSVLEIKVTNPDGTFFTKTLIFDSQNYVTEFITEQIGNYEIELSYVLGNINYSRKFIFSVAYSPEYDRFTIYDASNLYYMVSANGKISENGELVLENNNSIVHKYIFDFTPLLMTLSVLFFVFDVIVRKLRLQDIKSLFKFNYNKTEKERRNLND